MSHLPRPGVRTPGRSCGFVVWAGRTWARERKEDVLPCFLPALKRHRKPSNRERRKRGTKGEKSQGGEQAGAGVGSPLVLPALPWPSSRGLPKSCSLWRQRLGVRLLVQGGQRLQQDSSRHPSPKPSSRTEGSREMVGPRKMGDPMPTQSPDPKAAGWRGSH